MITDEYAIEAGRAFAQHCPNILSDSAAVKKIQDKIENFDLQLGYAPDIDRVLDWAKADEAALKEAADAAAQVETTRVEREARIHRDMKVPSELDKAEAVAELRSRSAPQIAPKEFTPPNLTDEEIEGLSSEEYRRIYLGDNSRVEDKQGASPLPPDRPRLYAKRKSYAERHPLEMAARQQREQIIAADKAERRKVKAEIAVVLGKGKQ